MRHLGFLSLFSFVASCLFALSLNAGTVLYLSGSFTGNPPYGTYLQALDGTFRQEGFLTPLFPISVYFNPCGDLSNPENYTFYGVFSGYNVGLGDFPTLLTLYGTITSGSYTGLCYSDPTTGAALITESGSFAFAGTWFTNLGQDTGWAGLGSISYHGRTLYCQSSQQPCDTIPSYTESGVMTTTATPEPSALLLLISGLVATAGDPRRMSKRR